MKRLCVCLLLIALILSTAAIAQHPEVDQQLASSRVENLNLIRFSGTVANPSRTGGVVGVTFSIYADAEGAQLLWSETQNVRTDRQGRYTVLLGAESGGVPPELFAGESARWLGARTADGRESKTLLVSVPYALKAAFAGNAETLAGQPASSFITRQEIQNSQIVLASGSVVPLAANGTTGKIAKFTSTDATNADIGDSSITEFSGTASCTVGSPCIGIGIDTPERTLHVKGASGAMLFDAGNIASNPVLFFAHDNFASKFRNRIMLDRTNESMQIWSQNGPRLFVVGDKVGINVAAPTQTLDVAGAVRAAGGIIFGDGTSLTTASNVSTITAVAAGPGLSGGGNSGAIGLSLMNCSAGQILLSGGANSWNCSTPSAGGGPISISGNTTSGILTATQANGAGFGVWGINNASSDFAVGVLGSSPNSTVGTGVLGEALAGSGFTTGVWGTSNSPEGAGGLFENYGNSGLPVGVWGAAHGFQGTGGYFAAFDGASYTSAIWAEVASTAGTAAFLVNYAIGGGNLMEGWAGDPPIRVWRVDHTGKGFFNGGTQVGGADFAESFDVVGPTAEYEPGDVLAIDVNGYRRVTKSNGPYSTLVAGIYSTKPGVLAHLPGADTDSQVPMAVIGVVPCKVSTENGPIKPGDLLVTSSRPGFAMKGTDPARMQGAIVGKALQALPEGEGLIEVLVTLQ